MKRIGWLILVLILGWTIRPLAAAEPQFSVVFAGKEGKYQIVRSPQLLVTKAGTLLAFAQGRSGSHDRSDNDIILKRSTDGGQTWSKFQVIAESDQDALNSICVVQLRDSGRILVVGCRFPAGYELQEFKYLTPALQEYQKKEGRDKGPAIKTGYEGADISTNYTIHSDDDGLTWSPMRDITRQVKRSAPDLCCVPGPGVAIQLRHGPHEGRIVVPCWTRWLDISLAKPGYRDRPYAAFSDDGGSTWQHGELVPAGEGRAGQGGETQMVELPGGAVQLNTRSAVRNVAVSQDGGQTWSALKEEPSLQTTPTAAGYIRYSGLDGETNSRLIFSNPTETGRKRGVISLSYDDGGTWPIQKALRPGRFSYSCLARLPDGQIACIFDGVADKGEFENFQGAGILLSRFTLDWLTDGKDK